ncbi:MAG: hypothetical protein QM535_06800 [Limnohabitans sp.]|nr:hypothetical protein [Limnohabitans sp.]
MEIIIKSFNRPYYLDKCLASIYEYTSGFTAIKILDDGTDDAYLQKLQSKYPFIQIFKSKLAAKKNNQIKSNKNLDTQIPVDLWVNAAKDSSDYFVLLEDDMWFTKPISFENLSKILSESDTVMVKLFWLNNNNLITQKTSSINSFVDIYESEISVKNPFLYNLIFHTKIPKLKGVLRLLGVFSKEKELKYYQLYNVAGAIFFKDFFLSLWNKDQKKVKEKNQIFNVLKYLQKNPKTKIAKTNEEYLKTGFISSALDKNLVVDFNIEKANIIFNELWFADRIKIHPNEPVDFDLTHFKEEIIGKSSLEFYQKWLLWTQKFKNMYIDIGCGINEY